MKRIRCPRCENYIVFDETRYTAGQRLVFQCTYCKKEFAIRLGGTKLTDIHSERRLDDHAYDKDCGSVVVLENQFCFKQVIPLSMGDNEFGRYVKGTSINKPIQTVDPSVDTFHCAIRVERDKQGRLKYVLRDAPSDTGTFVGTRILRDQDRLLLEDGAIITIGATTMILRSSEQSRNS